MSEFPPRPSTLRGVEVITAPSYARGIVCSRRGTLYRDRKHHDLRQSELAQDRAILLPVYAQMQDSDIEIVANVLKRELCR